MKDYTLQKHVFLYNVNMHQTNKATYKHTLKNPKEAIQQTNKQSYKQTNKQIHNRTSIQTIKSNNQAQPTNKHTHKPTYMDV